ncbi:MAG: glycosyltransferase family 25 protein [Planctomycetia bacterium]|nr:glycosyltransferase family 25 protein [Planctomycetia bacterium]
MIITQDIFSMYSRIVCITLSKRPERWTHFLDGLPDCLKGKIEKYSGTDGTKFSLPAWWKGHHGSYGCYLAHRRLLEECLSAGTENLLVFQDDAEFCEDFLARAETFHAHLPHDAEWIFYGGQHLYKDRHAPQPLNAHVYIPYNVNRLHAFALFGHRIMKLLHRYMSEPNWSGYFNTDHRWGDLQMARCAKIYCPARWMVYQRKEYSDLELCIKNHPCWTDACDIS